MTPLKSSCAKASPEADSIANASMARLENHFDRSTKTWRCPIIDNSLSNLAVPAIRGGSVADAGDGMPNLFKVRFLIGCADDLGSSRGLFQQYGV
jgi:hypothetical protein